MDGLGEDVRMRIVFATLGGCFGTAAFMTLAVGAWVPAIFLLIATLLVMWRATALHS